MKNVVVFAGNDCLKEKEEYYFNLAYKTGITLAENGFTVVSGGGPGLMNKVMQGAFVAGGKTIAVCLGVKNRIQTEFATEKYLFSNLIERQAKLIGLGDGFISLPGGIGTLYEISEIIALKRKNELSPKIPLILIDDYFAPLIIMFNQMVKEGFINDRIHKFYSLVDSPGEAINLLKRKFA